MPRIREPHDTDEDEAEPRPVFTGRRTPVTGVDTLPRGDPFSDVWREIAALRKSIRSLEELAAVLRGIPGHAGAIQQTEARIAAIKSDVAAMEDRMTEAIDKVREMQEEQAKSIAALDRVVWKIVIAAGLGGALVAVLITLGSAIIKAIK